MIYNNLYLLRTDGTISDHAQSIDVDIDVRMRGFASVRGTARWGQTIGTTGMADCVGLFCCNSNGAFLAHNLAHDHNWQIPPAFQTLNTLIINLNGHQYVGGSSDYAFKLHTRGLSMYRSTILRQPQPAVTLVAPKNDRDSLSGSGEFTEIDWESFGVPHNPAS